MTICNQSELDVPPVQLIQRDDQPEVKTAHTVHVPSSNVH